MFYFYLIFVFYKIIASVGCTIFCYLIANYKRNGVYVMGHKIWMHGFVGWLMISIVSILPLFFISNLSDLLRTFYPLLTVITSLIYAVGFGYVLSYKARIYADLINFVK